MKCAEYTEGMVKEINNLPKASTVSKTLVKKHADWARESAKEAEAYLEEIEQW